METKKRGLYIGRFQIIHNGHLAVIKYIESQPHIDEVTICIGSAQYSRFNQSVEAPLIINPFTYEEREAFVRGALEDELTKPFSIYPIQDMHDCVRWASYVKSKIPNIGTIYTNSRSEIKEFEKLGIQTDRFRVKDKYHAQVVREMIAYKDNWEKMIPKGAGKVIREQGLDNVLRELYNKNPVELASVHELQKKLGIITYEEAMKELR